MFWMFLFGSGLAYMFFKLGSYSVLISLFVNGSKFAVFLVLMAAIYFIYKKFLFRNKMESLPKS